ncbi:2,3-bisphosphoglycerate-independent phosphoglycerate mutase [Parvibaculum sp.]|uniref:2,3-bisphosphoglycerate-independent phosphoglycerate mutase n=1 Tax=Parvibaculum sp. TaxID=2024848 RepID=UPI002C61123C|nr:2,3-bisphosphoglycerate-independent phosphoglycerate mutase [Parvibaculum sp.]HUD51672.1 2,3-bisphosphoglycerate-independent phosphoglycerate mutase [Parvibaculum sp.]
MSGIVGVKPLVLVLLDGWGIRAEREGNALAMARTPIYDRLASTFPQTLLAASGDAVGLAAGKPGNAKAGFLTLGAGRPVEQSLLRINRAIQQDDAQGISSNPVLLKLVQRARSRGGAVHLIGMLSPGGIAGHQHHLAVLAALLSHEGVEVWVHAVMDGQDSNPQGGVEYLAEFLDDIAGADHAALGSLMGRAYAFDEPADSDLLKTALKAIATAEAPRTEYPSAHLGQAYDKGINDDRISPVVTQRYRGMRQDDAVLLVNLQPDLGRILLEALLDGPAAALLSGVCSLCELDGKARQHVEPLFTQTPVEPTLSETISRAGLSQLLLTETIAETNLSLFLRGGFSKIYDGETIGVAETPPFAKIEKRPDLAAADLAAEAIEAMRKAERDLLVLHMPNVAILGRTGNMRATVEAAEAVDKYLGKIAAQVEKRGATMIVTSAFGKGETMQNLETGAPWRGPTTSRTPFIFVDPVARGHGLALRSGTLSDVAPTVLELLGLDVPTEMTGRSLLAGAEQASRVPA